MSRTDPLRMEGAVRIERSLAMLARQIQALQREMERQREERDVSDALLRQDVANKVLGLQQQLATRHELFQLVRKLHRQVVCLRADSQQEHSRLLEAHGLPAPHDSWPSGRDFAEVRAMDPEPRPAERPPELPAGRSGVSPVSDERPFPTLDLPSHLANRGD